MPKMKTYTPEETNRLVEVVGIFLRRQEAVRKTRARIMSRAAII
jgi:hypothetical protein